MIVADPTVIRKGAAFVEAISRVIEEFGATVPAQADDGTVFDFAVSGTEFALTVVPGDAGSYALGLRSES